MVELTDPPTLEHGFVQGRFVTAVADTLDDDDRYPDLRGISGSVRCTADQPVNLVSAGTPATVVQQPVVLPLNSDGWLVDAHSENDPSREPGVWLAVGRYQVQTIFPSATPVPQFSIEVTAEHTKESPLNLTLAAPIILPPRTTEVTRVIDRQLAQQAAGEAEGFRDEAEQFNTWAGENAGYAEGHAQDAAGHATDAETARDQTVALGITVDTSAGTRVSIGNIVTYYNSGWRNISSAVPSWGWINPASSMEPDEGVWVRRLLDAIQVRVVGTVRTEQSATLKGEIVWGIPATFYPRFPEGAGQDDVPIAAVVGRPGSETTFIYSRRSSTGRVWVDRMVPVGTKVNFVATIPIETGLPTSLPGTPA